MKLTEYNLVNWLNGRIKRQKKINNIKVLLLSIDRTKTPPKEGRRNIVAVDNEDNIIWIAELPTDSFDSYVEMKYTNGIIRAESSNSFISEIDFETGNILRKYMVK